MAKVSCYVRKLTQQMHFHLCSNGCLFFLWGANFCMGAYKRDVIKMGAYIHGVLILCGCLISRFYSMHCTSYYIGYIYTIILKLVVGMKD